MTTHAAPSPAYARIDVDPLPHRIARGINLTAAEVAAVHALRVHLGATTTDYRLARTVEDALARVLPGRRFRVTPSASGGTVEIEYRGGRKHLGGLHVYTELPAVA